MSTRDRMADAIRRAEADHLGARDLFDFNGICPAERARFREQADAVLLLLHETYLGDAQSYAGSAGLGELVDAANSVALLVGRIERLADSALAHGPCPKGLRQARLPEPAALRRAWSRTCAVVGKQPPSRASTGLVVTDRPAHPRPRSDLHHLPSRAFDRGAPHRRPQRPSGRSARRRVPKLPRRRDGEAGAGRTHPILTRQTRPGWGRTHAVAPVSGPARAASLAMYGF